jgi:TetR/AcrR family fatty acid metabolism transcriptional regulator
MARPNPNDKRRQILDGALKVFAAKGFYNTKVSEVARQARVADGTIYNYFKSKDDLLISLFEDRMDWILKRLREELDDAQDVGACFRRYIELHVSLARIEPELAEFITVELRQSHKFLHEYKNPKFAEYLRVLAGLIERGQAEGRFRPEIDPRLASRAIFGALDEMLLWLTWARRESAVDEVVQQVADIFLAGLDAQHGE